MTALDLGKFGKVASPITTEQGVLTVAEYIAVDASNEKNLKQKLDELEESIGSGGGSGLPEGVSITGEVVIEGADGRVSIGTDSKDGDIVHIGTGVTIGNNVNIPDNFDGSNISGGSGGGLPDGVIIGEDVVIGDNSNTPTSSNVYIGSNTILAGGGINIGRKVEIAGNTYIGKDVSIGDASHKDDNVHIGTQVFIGTAISAKPSGMTDEVYIGKGVYIPNGFDGSNASGGSGLPDGVIIGSGVTIGDGVTIGKMDDDTEVALGSSIAEEIGVAFGTGANITTHLNLNDVTVRGTKEEFPGPRTLYFDHYTASADNNWPLSGTVSGHIVVNATMYNTDAGGRFTHSQMLYVTNGSGNDYKIFLRDGESGIRTDGTPDKVSEWRDWKEVQVLALCGNGEPIALSELDNYVDNGMYGGVAYSGSSLEETLAARGEVETFTMIVVNNYAISAAVSAVLGYPVCKQIIQYKISVPLNYDQAIIPEIVEGKIQKRTGACGSDDLTWTFSEWANAGGVSIV